MIKRKKKYDLTKPVRAVVMFGIAALGCLLIGDAIAGIYFDATHPEFHSPIPNGYIFEVQAQEEIILTPMPSPTPELSEVPKTDAETIIEYIKTKDWNVEDAVKIARCESIHFTDFIGDTSLQYEKDGIMYGASYGPFQIRYLPGRPTPEELLDPKFNVDYAYSMYKSQSWTPWTCKKVLN